MREHQLIDIEKILVNPENPRHTQIMIADELFIMQQLVRNFKEAKTMIFYNEEKFNIFNYIKSISQ